MNTIYHLINDFHFAAIRVAVIIASLPKAPVVQFPPIYAYA
jgi:hypothetical protein